MEPLQIPDSLWRYQAMIGTGGIGSGRFFALKGNHTLGREESRAGRFLEGRDYCKLHIVSHYVKTLLGPQFTAVPIGKVGDDEEGQRLLQEMAEVGLDLRYVSLSPGDQTLFSFCFIYPDGSGGNLTTEDSASAKVSAAFIAKAEPEFARFQGRGIALAVPEVPLEARLKLLQLGTKHRFFRVAALTSEEARSALAQEMLSLADLLAVNVDEATAIAGVSAEGGCASVVTAAVQRLRHAHPHLLLSITAGRDGSWCWDGEALVHVPAFRVKPVRTAGAGDAYLAGMVIGRVAGLTMPQAQELASLIAALAVTSPHTINKEIDRESLRAFAAQVQASLCEAVKNLLED
jgi:ribokinase